MVLQLTTSRGESILTCGLMVHVATCPSPLLQASSSEWLSCNSCCTWERDDCSCCTWVCRDVWLPTSWALSCSSEAWLSRRVWEIRSGGRKDQLDCTAPEILFTLPNPNPYPTCALTQNLNFQYCVFQVRDG